MSVNNCVVVLLFYHSLALNSKQYSGDTVGGLQQNSLAESENALLIETCYFTESK